MKKIVMGAAALLCAASMFAVDFAATVKLAGDIAGGAVTEATNDATYIWKLNSNDQKDNDALKLSVSGDKAGASFQFWYKYNGGADVTVTSGKVDDGSVVKVRSTSIWVKPIDQLKIIIGDVSEKTFTNTLDYWKDPVGNDHTRASSWVLGYSSYATVEGAGIAAELTPIEGLTVVAGIAAGADKNFITFTENVSEATVLAYGASIKYNLSAAAGIPVNVAVAWRDAGTSNEKVLAVGADYGNAYADGFYGMLNARFLFQDDIWWGTSLSASGKDYKLTGIAFDNFFQYKTGALTIALRAPFVLRGLAGETGAHVKLDASNDPSYLYWSAKVSYALDGLTVYVGAGSDYDDNLNAWVFNKVDASDTFNVTIHPGVTFNIGAAAFDVGARFDIKDAVASTVTAGAKVRPFAWSIPFTATIGF